MSAGPGSPRLRSAPGTWTQGQADQGPFLQELHVEDNPGHNQFPGTLVALTGTWSSPTRSLVLSPAFLIVLRPHGQN